MAIYYYLYKIWFAPFSDYSWHSGVDTLDTRIIIITIIDTNDATCSNMLVGIA